ncbi:hypothetical protein [Caenimonas koreensis]|uniref:hypothetical protein n=1 Tax=Caenimonas koreensis TaxID=367474 RepID=UPI00378314BE
MKTLQHLLCAAAATVVFSAAAQQPAATPASTPAASVPCPAASAQRTTTAQWLIGSWRHVELSRYANGKQISKDTYNGENVLRFECDGRWSLNGPKFKSSGTYRWLGPDQLEQTILESNHPVQKGQVSTKRIVAEFGVMEMHAQITQEQLQKQQRPMKIDTPGETVRVISFFQRMTLR